MPRIRAHPFVDLEAEVDNKELEEENSEEDDEMQDNGRISVDFIDFNEITVEQHQCREPYHTWNTLEGGVGDKGSNDDIDDEDREIESFLAHLERHKITPAAGTSTSTDKPLQRYPLHRVACRAGMEEEALVFLLQKTQDERLASAFLRDSIRGYIYIEAVMDQPVIELLARAPGIRRTARGPITQGVDDPDWSKLLTMKSTRSRCLKQGEWVTVKTGAVYKGDVGLVKRVEAWGAQVLLVPRIRPLIHSLQQTDYEDVPKKRKSTPIVPEARLFQEFDIARSMGLTIIEEGLQCYRLGDNSFEYGLARRSYSPNSLRASVVSIPASTFHHFINSQHPALRHSIDQLPKPTEWIIQEGDIVEDTESNRRGNVRKVDQAHIEIELDDGTGLHALPWRLVRKVVNIADYVELISGVKGWVVGKSDDILHIVNKLGEQANTSLTEIIEIDVHLNRVKHTQMPFVAAVVQSTPLIPVPKDYIPWIGTRVLVTKGVWKSRYASIRTVLMHENPIKLVVRIESLNPHHAFNDVNLRVDDVVEAVSEVNLLQYSKQRHLYVPIATRNPSSSAASSGIGNDRYSGSGTPLPEPTSTPLMPAWDPNSQTPLGFETTSLVAAGAGDTPSSRLQASSSSSPSAISINPLLDRRLLHVKLKANVHGGGIPGTQMTVWLNEKDDKTLGLQCIRGGRMGWLQPNWLQLRHPTPARADNGLMVVIDQKSEHFGKLVRRVSHHRSANRTLMRCVVVTCEPGEVNDITSEELDSLDESQLCLCFETKDEKDLNKKVVSELRARGRST